MWRNVRRHLSTVSSKLASEMKSRGKLEMGLTMIGQFEFNQSKDVIFSGRDVGTVNQV